MTQSNTEPTATQRWDDLDALMIPFRERIVALLGRLTALGLHPLLWETYRSPERAAQLVAQGKSHAKGGLSMHCYGIAADVICRDHHWECHAHGCDFFQALGEQAKRCGLTWGGDWASLHDLPHVQGVPVEMQERIRHAASQAERESILVAGLRPTVP